MRKNFILVLVIALLTISSQTVFSQKKSTAKKPGAAKSKSGAQTVKKNAAADDEAVFQNKLQATLKNPESWTQYTFAKPGFRILFPRQPVLKQEDLYDDAFGKTQLNTYFALADNGVFAAAHFELPYRVNDDAALRSIYQEIAKGFLADDEIKIVQTKDVQYDGRLGLELSGENKNNPLQKTRMRFFLVGRNVFFNLVMPYPPENSPAQQMDENQAKLEKTTNDFFNSFVQTTNLTAPVVKTVSPVFNSTFADDIFKSEYFDFTIEIPRSWREIPQEDVDTIRESRKEVIKRNSKLDVSSVPNVRRNLFSFTAKPLGSEKNPMLVCNLLKKPFPEVTVYELTNKLEQTLAEINFYTITKKTHAIKVGENDFYGFETKGVLEGEEYRQSIYYCLKKDYALGFVLTYYSNEEKQVLVDSLNTLKFNARR